MADKPPYPHQYVSTACHHEKHDVCRLTCKFCPAGCQCECHFVMPNITASAPSETQDG